jgi:hypothetical protein
MRCHIDFIRHETNCDYTVVVIGSLQKNPVLSTVYAFQEIQSTDSIDNDLIF